ncbi:MAG: AMP-binding protein [Clostridia bacterium]|nr:AMP-binding protein [Clostridia bacterium]MBQ8400133.1 AMP-binding protein [Clostridia bacterium]
MAILQKKKLSLFDVTEFDNFRTMLTLAKEEAGDTIAIKYKERGSIRDVTYNELLGRVNALGTALSHLDGGLGTVAILGENSPRYITVLLSVLCSQGVAVPLDTELPFAEITNILNHCEATTVFCDKTFLEQFEQHRKELPNLKNLICFQTKEHEETEAVLSYSALLERGANTLLEGDFSYCTMTPADKRMCLLLYKAGSIDSLKGIMISQFALRSAIIGSMQLVKPGSRCMSVLSFDRTFELVHGLLSSLHGHATICINESKRTFQKNIQEYKPDFIILPPLYVENIWQKTIQNIEKQGRTETMEKLIKTSHAMRKVGIDKRKTFFSALHDMLGGKLETIIVGGASVNPDAVRFFDDIGITVLAGYGTTECLSSISISSEKRNDFASAGVLLPCMQIKIDNPNEDGEGEICARGDAIMMGYYKNDRATKEAVELSGWYHTGDLGKINALGQLYVTGRKKNVIVFKSGKSVLPEEIETYLCALPFIKSAKVYAGKDQGGAEISLIADVVLEQENLAQMSKSERIALVKEKIDALNRTLPSYKRIDSVHIRK